jgi:hypothetical protein
MAFKEKISEKKQKNPEEEMKVLQRHSRKDLAGIAYIGSLIIGSAIVAGNPAITNEVLQTIAGAVQNFTPILGLGIGVSSLDYALNKKRCIELSKQMDQARANNQENKEEKEEEKGMQR